MRRVLPFLLAVAVLGCSSAPGNPFRPAVAVEQLNQINFTANTSTPVGLEILINNKAPEAMTVTRVNIQGGFSQQYDIGAIDRPVSVTVAPGETRSLEVVVTARSLQGLISDPEPLNLRAFITYMIGGQRYEDYYLFRPIMQ